MNNKTLIIDTGLAVVASTVILLSVKALDLLWIQLISWGLL